jgi:hypothetical protein
MPVLKPAVPKMIAVNIGLMLWGTLGGGMT